MISDVPCLDAYAVIGCSCAELRIHAYGRAGVLALRADQCA